MGCKTLDVALVEELACLDEINVMLLQLAPLNNVLFLIAFLVLTHILPVAIVDGDMGIPKSLSYSLSAGKFDVEEDGCFARQAESRKVSQEEIR